VISKPKHTRNWIVSLLGCLFLCGSVSAQTNPDPARINWEAKDKYFLTVAASKTADSATSLPYATVDGSKVSSVFASRGYKKLESLADKTATRENFIENLKKIRNVSPNGLVVIYYSGHGAVDIEGRDLWLQLYGQNYFGEGHGVAVSELIRTARGTSYKGELVVIIDACYSGQGAWTKSLNLSEVENTLIFASNTRTQEAYPIELSPNEKMSAFTYYLLRGLTDDWEIVDEKRQGIILYEDLRTYIEVKLNQLVVKSGVTDKQMTPEIAGQPGKIWAAFDAAKTKNLQSLLRQAISFRTYLSSQLPSILDQTRSQSLTPPVMSPEATALAQQVPANADPYTKALQFIAEERYLEALPLLDQAEKQKAADIADIYQARGNAMVYLGKFLDAKKWYEKALSANRRENPELLEEASMLFLLVSDSASAERMLRQALQIRERNPNSPSLVIQDLFFLSLLSFMQGNISGAEGLLVRLQQMDPKALDGVEEGFSLMPSFLLSAIKVMQGKSADAEKFARDFEAKAAKLDKDDPLRITNLFLLVMVSIDGGRDSEVPALVTQFLDSWERALAEQNSSNVTVHIGFLVGMAGAVDEVLGVTPTIAARFEDLSNKSLDLIKKDNGAESIAVGLSLFNLAQAHRVTENYRQAEAEIKEAIKIADQAAGKNNALSGIMYAALGDVLIELERYPEAQTALTSGLSIAENTTGPTSVFAFMIVEGLARLSEKQERYEEAVAYYKRLQGITKQLIPTLSSLADYAEDIAAIRVKQKRFSEAEVLYKQAITSTETALNPTHTDLIPILNSLGSVYVAQQKYEQAEPVLRRSLSLMEGKLRSYSENFANTLMLLYDVYSAQQKVQDAAKTQARLEQIAGELRPGDKDVAGYIFTKLAARWDERQNAPEATRLYELAAALYETEPQATSQAAATYLYNIGRFYLSRANYPRAEQLLLRAVSIDEAVYGKEHVQVAIDLESLGEVYTYQQKGTEGVAVYRRATAIRSAAGEHERAAMNLRNEGYIHFELKAFNEAREAYTKAIALWDTNQRPNNKEVGLCLAYLARVESFAGNPSLAELHLRRVITIDEKELKDRHVLVEDLISLADTHRVQREYKEAREALERARKLLQKDDVPAEPLTSQVLFITALVHRSEAKDKRYEEFLQQALNRPRNASQQAEIAQWLVEYAKWVRLLGDDLKAREVEGWARALSGQGSK
jgi:tetratricopeptide (TPR) repeat protein